MPGIFPSLCAFRGVGGIGKLKAKSRKPPREVGEAADQIQSLDKPLSELNQGYSRMMDTFVYDYPQLVRDNSDPFANVTDQSVKVAIIGAGYAGATAAYELRRAGITDITIYEARRDSNGDPLVGGRAYSPTFTSNSKEYVNEMGPMRVPENSKLFWHYFSKVWEKHNPGEADQIQKIFPNPGVVATQLIFRGLKYSWNGDDSPQPEEPDNPNNVNWEQLQKDIGEFIGSLNYEGESVNTIAKLLQQKNLTFEKVRIFNYWRHFLLKYNDVPFIKALEDYFGDRWGEEQYNMFATLGLGTGGFGPLFPVCFLEIFRLLLWQYDQEYSPSMPMADIVDGLLSYHNDGPSINILNETVDYIGIDTEENNKVNVYSINTNNNINSQQYDYVIVATTLRSMQIRMNLDAKVPPRDYGDDQSNHTYKSTAVFGSDDDYKIRESIRIPHIMNSSKLFGLMEPKPWAKNLGIEGWPEYEGEPIKCVLTDTLARQMYFLDPYPEQENAASNVLISYNWGDDSTKIMAIRNYESYQTIYPSNSSDFVLNKAYQFGIEGSLGKDDPIAKALDSIQVGEANTHLASVVWQEEPMIYGAFKIDYPNQYYATSQLVYQYQQLNKRVYLAGNNCSFYGGWIEGAMQSAVNASAAVLRQMEVEEKAENFRMEDLFNPNPFENVLDELENSQVFV